VYFGPIGEHSKVLTDYFEGKGSRKFGEDENPAEGKNNGNPIYSLFWYVSRASNPEARTVSHGS
jgi:hypothetical protein